MEEGSVDRIESAADRDPGTRRLIEWTGERCVPWIADSAMLYEHFHRYLWAARVLAGRRVLDIGCGEGFGAAILAESAASVVGVDIDAAAIEHAGAAYARPNLSFVQASAMDLSRFDAESFTAVTAFEMIEHIDDHKRVMAEIERLLTADGILAISTPDKDLYSEASGQANPFHEHELSLAEFRGLLSACFPHVAIWGQRTITGSYMSALELSDAGRRLPATDFAVRHSPGGGVELADEPDTLFCVALASRSVLPAVSSSSTLADTGLELVHETARAHAVAVAERDRLLGDVNAQLAHANRTIDEKREELLSVGRKLASVEAKLLETGDDLNDARTELDAAQVALRRVELSVSWQLLQRARGLFYGVVGEGSWLGVRFSRMLQFIGRLLPKPRD